MRIEQLIYLVTLFHYPSLTVASEHLYISQQSLGKAIKELESELHTDLIIRTSRGIDFTEQGKEAVEMASSILSQIDEFKNHFSHFNHSTDSLAGNLLVLCCQAAYPQIMPKTIRTFQQIHPNAKIITMERDGLYLPLLHLQLYKERKDTEVISIINLPSLEEYPDIKIPDELSFHPLCKTKWLACVSKNNPALAKMKKISMKTLLKHPIIVQSPDYAYNSTSCIDYFLFNRFGTPNIKMVIDDLELFCQAIETNMGVSIASNICTNVSRIKNSKDMVLIDIKEKQTVQLGYLITNDMEDSPLVRGFVQALKQALKEFPFK
ncbi:MAG: LysR family transcriptional regulator [Bacillota bacterium]|nr:LysR family transcriptional regulator [Bacillota bacterium]